MDALTAIQTIEGDNDELWSEEISQEAWQTLIDSGIVWTLQGWYGRTARDLIAEGLCVDTHNVLGRV